MTEQSVFRLIAPKVVAERLADIFPEGKWSTNKVWSLAKQNRFPHPIMYSPRRGAWRAQDIEDYVTALRNGEGPLFYPMPERKGAIATSRDEDLDQSESEIDKLLGEEFEEPAKEDPVKPARKSVVFTPTKNPMKFDDIPLPEKNKWTIRERERKYNFEDMEVGKCIVCSFEEGEKNWLNKSQAAYAFGKKNNWGFRSGKIQQGEWAGKAWGIWRIK